MEGPRNLSEVTAFMKEKRVKMPHTLPPNTLHWFRVEKRETEVSEFSTEY
jgi:hypothetical protein